MQAGPALELALWPAAQTLLSLPISNQMLPRNGLVIQVGLLVSEKTEILTQMKRMGRKYRL